MIWEVFSALEGTCQHRSVEKHFGVSDECLHLHRGRQIRVGTVLCIGSLHVIAMAAQARRVNGKLPFAAAFLIVGCIGSLDRFKLSEDWVRSATALQRLAR